MRTRRFPRLRVNLPSNISVPLAKGFRHESKIKELGQGGCLVITELRLEIGTNVPMRILLGDEEEVWLLGKVLYNRRGSTEGKSYGIKFIDSIDGAQKLVGKYVKERY